MIRGVSGTVLKEMQQTLREPVEFAGNAAGGKADVSAFAREIERDGGADLIAMRQRVRWHEPIFLCCPPLN